MSVYRLAVGVTGLFHVQAESEEEAIANAKVAIEKGGITILGKQVLQCAASVTLVKKLDDAVLKPDNITITTKTIQ